MVFRHARCLVRQVGFVKPATTLFAGLGMGLLLFALTSKRSAATAPPLVVVPSPGPGPLPTVPSGDAGPEPSTAERIQDFRFTWAEALGDMLSLERYYQKKGQNEDANLLAGFYTRMDAALPSFLRVSEAEGVDIEKPRADAIFDSLRSRFEELSRSADILEASAAGDVFREAMGMFETLPPRSLPTV